MRNIGRRAKPKHDAVMVDPVVAPVEAQQTPTHIMAAAVARRQSLQPGPTGDYSGPIGDLVTPISKEPPAPPFLI